MLLWRLSGRQHAEAFDGGYGLLFDGRWNTIGHAVTYCATSPSLCVLEKLVHIEDPSLLPDLVMLTYDVPDDLDREIVALADLPTDWRQQEALTQRRGDAWYHSRAAPLLQVPSVIVPLVGSPDQNVVINHAHPDVAAIRRAASVSFALDAGCSDPLGLQQPFAAGTSPIRIGLFLRETRQEVPERDFGGQSRGVRS
jgi:RES domain-containing protein